LYLPLHFKEERPLVLEAAMRAAPFASVVVAADHGIEANHLPLHVRKTEEGLLVVGHVARANPVWTLPVRGEALALFSGPHGYVSPSAFASKREHGKVVPTWNYVAVHAHGPIRWIEDERWLAELLEELTAEHEAGRAEPWKVSDAPAAFTQGLLRAIVGLEIRVTRLEGKLKLSQNRSRADREGVIAELRARGDEASGALAAAMQAALDAPAVP
jgi:transcriptional regulator